MSDLSIPAANEVTSEWLTDALRNSGTIKDATVTSIEVEGDIAAGVGFMGELAKVALTYDQAEEGAPASIIAKFPAAAPDNREIAEVFRFYEIETRFYQQIADDVELNTPKLYYGDIDLESGDFILLLQDLAPSQVADQIAGLTSDQTDLAVRELAKFHATWWEHPRLQELDWMWAMNHPVRAETSQQSYQQAWGPFVESFGTTIQPEILDIGERFGQQIVAILDEMSKGPKTISHGDYRPDNLFFATPAGGDPLTVIDWQIMSIGPGTFDFSYFLLGSLPPDERKARQTELLQMYHDLLVEGGVTNYSYDQCYQDYRISSLFCWLYTVIALGTLDVANERGLALFTANIERNSSALLELNAGELLPS